ncbi:hypothetical protein NM208_g5178 [Fusarium decemcellulare]|nr:hypothetical protein NM208_g5178 [Fusarium decemcellulare]
MMEPGRAEQRQGYVKIESTCRLAKQQGLAYAWIDTCCIDKRSSAELAEAINSMYRWYKCSRVCYAHLEDLEPHQGREEDTLHSLPSCRWFTRGWTLQELIASDNIEFYGREWQYRGTKAKLRHQISDITGIDIAVLENNALLESIPIAKRMSWAANRQTTRVEDTAYCLLGIFDVNMPMMYGEGAKAFARLQEEIVKESTDLSLFAWKVQKGSENPLQAFRGILAQSPAEFAHCRHLRKAPSMRYGFEFAMTNKGLRIEAILGQRDNKDYLWDLACMIPNDDGENSRIGVFLTKTADGYVRTRPAELYETDDTSVWSGPRRKIFLRKRVTGYASWNLKSLLDMNLAVRFSINGGFRLHSFAAKPTDLWDPLHHCFITGNSEQFTGFLDFTISDLSNSFTTSRIFVVCGLTINPDSGPLRTLRPWMATYDSQDTAGSEKIIVGINGYYNSYGEENFLHLIRDRVLAREVDMQHEISVPSSDATERLYISLGAPQGTDDGAYTLSVNIVNR